MDSYIVRIYRREKEHSQEQLVGMVENVKQGSKQSFKNIKELWQILYEQEANIKHKGRKADD